MPDTWASLTPSSSAIGKNTVPESQIGCKPGGACVNFMFRLDRHKPQSSWGSHMSHASPLSYIGSPFFVLSFTFVSCLRPCPCSPSCPGYPPVTADIAVSTSNTILSPGTIWCPLDALSTVVQFFTLASSTRSRSVCMSIQRR